MAFFKLGSIRGLDYKIPYQQIIQQDMQQEALNNQAKEAARQRAMTYAQLLKTKQLPSKYHSQKYEEYTKPILKQMGDLSTSNPNWIYDTNAVAQMTNWSDQLLNNPIVQDFNEQQEQLKMLEQENARGKFKNHPDKFVEQFQHAHDILDHGYYEDHKQLDADGRPVKISRYTYEAPTDFDFNKHVKEVEGLIKGDFTITPGKYGYISGSVAKPENIKNVTSATYIQNKDEIDDIYNEMGGDNLGFRSPYDWYNSMFKNSGGSLHFSQYQKDSGGSSAKDYSKYKVNVLGGASNGQQNPKSQDDGLIEFTDYYSEGGRNYLTSGQDIKLIAGNVLTPALPKGDIIIEKARNWANIGGVPSLRATVLIDQDTFNDIKLNEFSKVKDKAGVANVNTSSIPGSDVIEKNVMNYYGLVSAIVRKDGEDKNYYRAEVYLPMNGLQDMTRIDKYEAHGSLSDVNVNRAERAKESVQPTVTTPSPVAAPKTTTGKQQAAQTISTIKW